ELLSEIFSVMFGNTGPESDKRISTYYDVLKRALSPTVSGSVRDLGVLFNAWRTRSIIGDYETLKKRKFDIFKSRSDFLVVLNDLFPKDKEFLVSSKSELCVRVRNKMIPLESLSSGEKQMIILLGQAFIQERRRIIYIADEPEISLHIKWQEKLAESIRKINDRAQLIFATHSPDIVGRKALNVIKLK
ncbi:MAG: AAA family ATPase, partial [Turicibacter sp.]